MFFASVVKKKGLRIYVTIGKDSNLIGVFVESERYGRVTFPSKMGLIRTTLGKNSS